MVRDLTFALRPGQTSAIIGGTGSGKTTLLNLIPRFFDATSGAVLVNGTDVREQSAGQLWSAIGLVPQAAFLFRGTVASNLRFGAAGGHRRGAVARARGRAGPRLRRQHARAARRPHRPGRHQRLRRPAPAAFHRPGAGQAARPVPVRRLLLGPGRRPPTPACAPRCGPRPRTPPWSSSRSGSARSCTPTRSSCSTPGRIAGIGTHAELLAELRGPTRRSSPPSSGEGVAA